MIRVGMSRSQVSKIRDLLKEEERDFVAAFDLRARSLGFKFTKDHCTCASEGSCETHCGWYQEIN